jgi:hypothetical protein
LLTDPTEILQVLPDLSDWPYVGERELNGESLHLWRYEKKYEHMTRPTEPCLSVMCAPASTHTNTLLLLRQAVMPACLQAQRKDDGLQVRTVLRRACARSLAVMRVQCMTLRCMPAASIYVRMGRQSGCTNAVMTSSAGPTLVKLPTLSDEDRFWHFSMRPVVSEAVRDCTRSRAGVAACRPSQYLAVA